VNWSPERMLAGYRARYLAIGQKPNAARRRYPGTRQ
jgi:hypothetical protein